jgi:hypothetical protein
MSSTLATRPRPLQFGTPLLAKPCPGHGHERQGDIKTMTCGHCGRQVNGFPMPDARPRSKEALHSQRDQLGAAGGGRKKPRYRANS